jgi:hypothetical protein
MVSRPKKWYFATASAANVPSTSASAVAPSAALTDSQSASRTASSYHATLNHFVLQRSIGHVWVTLRLNA